MKLLVLSDVHFPYTNANFIKNLLKQIDPDKIILLGDIFEEKQGAERFFDLLKSYRYIMINGDNDKIKSIDIYRETIDGKKFVFMHGHQFQIINEKTTGKLALVGKRLHQDLPLILHALYARVALHLANEYLILGHTHALRYIKLLRTAYAGTLYKFGGWVYADRGYIIIENGKIILHKIDKALLMK